MGAIATKPTRHCFGVNRYSPFILLITYYFFLQVLIPKGKYKGQKLTKLVSVNTAANTSNTMPKVPLMVPVKYSAAIIIATINLIMRSAVPIFVFITIGFMMQIWGRC